MVAFKEFYQKYSILLLEIAYKKIQNFHEAEEVVQDAFLAFYNSKEKIEDNPWFYLQGILRHKIFDYKRRKGFPTISLDNTNEVPDQTENKTLENIRLSELSNNISYHINSLPKQCKTAFMLSRHDELSYTEISHKMGISLKTVEAHISKALKYLREHVDHRLVWLIWLLSVIGA